MNYKDAVEAAEIIEQVKEIESLKDSLLEISNPTYAEISDEANDVKIHNKGLVDYLRNQAILYLDNKIGEAKSELLKIGEDESNTEKHMDIEASV